MLLSLQIRNFALIENATIEFGDGLNILSGETGAGKSIIVQAIELLLGERGSADLIRSGEDEAEVTGLFALGDSEMSLRRVISRAGRNKATVDERPVPVAVLAEKGEQAIDLVRQNEHQILLQPARHLDLLDEFAHLSADIRKFQEELDRYRELLGQKEDLIGREKEARDKEEFLRFQQKELSGAEFEEGEEERLKQEKEVVRHSVRLGETCIKGEEAIESGESSLTETLARIAKDVAHASEIDLGLADTAKLLAESLCQLQEAAKNLRSRGQKLSYDPERLQALEDRLALLSQLKRKYGGSIQSLKSKKQEIAESLRLLDHFEEEIQKKDQELAQQAKVVLKSTRKLSESRKESAQKLSRSVEKEIRSLGMAAARFEIALQPLSDGIPVEKIFLNDRGAERAEFVIAPNPGEGMRPLAKIASGGEVSRLFLAIKKVLGGLQDASASIFDEVDAGIGGGVAEAVGKSLFLLSRKRQVICITHLPQIACYADQHFVIQKRVHKGRTQTDIERLGQNEREKEIARMLAGIHITDQALAHAREMLKNAGANPREDPREDQ